MFKTSIRKKFLACFLTSLFFSHPISNAMENLHQNSEFSSYVLKEKIENLDSEILNLLNAETTSTSLDDNTKKSLTLNIKKIIEDGILNSKLNKLLDELTQETGVILDEQEKKGFIVVIKNFIENAKEDIDLKELISLFKFNIGEKNYTLIPMCKSEKHKDCLMRIFCEEDEKDANDKKKEYMKYYLKGNLYSKEEVEKRFFKCVVFEGNKIRSLPLMPAFKDKIIGRIGLAPLTYHSNVCLEIGYALEQEYSGKKIMSNAVKRALELLQFLKDKGIYDYTKIRATAKPDNQASNKILSNLNFIKSESFIDDGYGKENEYYYNFN